MHLFTRTRAIDPRHAAEEHAFAVELSRYASTTTGVEVVPWATVYGGPSGTVCYAARVESQAEMAEALATLAADAGYQERIADRAGDALARPVVDAIGEIIGVAGSDGPSATLAAVTTARCTPGRVAEAMAWAVDNLSHHSKVSGLDGALVRSLYGPLVTLVWVHLAGSWEDVDASSAALAADVTYLERIDDAGPLLLAGSTEQRLLRRLD